MVERFERFEFKFFAPRTVLERAMDLVGPALVEDRFERAPGEGQVNTSLYLDSPHDTFLAQHLAGSPDRIKLRVRFYGQVPTGACFFEIKRRVGPVVTKRRAVLELPDTCVLLEDFSRPVALRNEALEDFRYLAMRCRVRPRLLVQSRRRAFRAVDGSDVRVTIDDAVAWQPPALGRPLVPHSSRWRSIAAAGPDAALMEVKFLTVRPWWLGALTRALGPWRVSFSKYVAAAMEARRDPFFTFDALGASP